MELRKCKCLKTINDILKKDNIYYYDTKWHTIHLSKHDVFMPILLLDKDGFNKFFVDVQEERKNKLNEIKEKEAL